MPEYDETILDILRDDGGDWTLAELVDWMRIQPEPVCASLSRLVKYRLVHITPDDTFSASIAGSA